MQPQENDGFVFRFDRTYMGQVRQYDSIRILQISENSLEPSREIPEHRQMCHEISYVISGKGAFYSGDSCQMLQSGDIQLISKGTPHKIVPDGQSNLRFCNIGFDLEDGCDRELVPVRELFESIQDLCLHDRGELRMAMTMLIGELYAGEKGSALMIECYLKQILVLVNRLAEATAAQPAVPESTAERYNLSVYAIVRYVDNNVYSFPSIRDISRDLGYSESHISHSFREKMGITLREYICRKKVEASLDFLGAGRYTVTQIAQMLNYSSLQSFSKAFQRIVGCSPTEYCAGHRTKSKAEAG